MEKEDRKQKQENIVSEKNGSNYREGDSQESKIKVNLGQILVEKNRQRNVVFERNIGSVVEVISQWIEPNECEEARELVEKIILSWDGLVTDQKDKEKRIERQKELQGDIDTLKEKISSVYKKIGPKNQDLEKKYTDILVVLDDFSRLKNWVMTRSSTKKYDSLQQKYPTGGVLIKSLKDVIGAVEEN